MKTSEATLKTSEKNISLKIMNKNEKPKKKKIEVRNKNEWKVWWKRKTYEEENNYRGNIIGEKL